MRGCVPGVSDVPADVDGADRGEAGSQEVARPGYSVGAAGGFEDGFGVEDVYGFLVSMSLIGGSVFAYSCLAINAGTLAAVHLHPTTTL